MPPLVSKYLLPEERQLATVRVHPAIIIGPMILVVAGSAIARVLGKVAHVNSPILIIICRWHMAFCCSAHVEVELVL